MAIKNLIFDLGGVILDLDVPRTIKAFADLAGISAEEAERIFHQSPEFNAYEKGEMADDEFRTFLKKTYAKNSNYAEIDKAWNEMLRGIPMIKLELLERLKNTHRVLLLSNTNEIHLTYINGTILPSINAGNSLDVFFHKAYYSHRMLKRKPEPEIFEQVIEENKFNPAETLFLDDNKMNIKGAESVGLQVAYVNTPNFILDYFR